MKLGPMNQQGLPRSRSVFEWIRMFLDRFGFADNQLTLEQLDFEIQILITEEFDELVLAHKEGDAEEVIDALGDLSWLCIKLMKQLDVDPVKVFNQIGTANMSKKRGTKSTRPDSDGFDVVKPEGWKPPDHRDNHGDLDEIYSTTSTS